MMATSRKRILSALGLVLALGAATAASASADPVKMASKNMDETTRDGWHIHIDTDNEVVNAIPNLAAAANSREAFVTLSATATVSAGSSSISDSLFIMGYQLGCQSDVSSGLQIGGAATGGGSLGGEVDINSSPGVSGSGSIGGGLTGYIQTDVAPGAIVDLPMSNMALSDKGKAMLDITNLHIKADACGGDVTIRSYAYLRISTDAAHSSYAIYGDPIKI
ncbi:MAG: MspA family porin [Segniliparus sp.]|uniref:MspA family porin n=1 Tax=Segniliparus sp. TaxID=2804064 RepID=UPI003F2F9C98